MFAGALAVGVMQVALAADTRSPAEEAADRAAIEALMWRYVRALDSMDADGYAAVFTEDGKFKSGSTQHQGRAEMKEMIAGLKKTRDERSAAGTPSAPMYHVIANHQITFTGPNEARYDSYWMTVFGAEGQPILEGIGKIAGLFTGKITRVPTGHFTECRDISRKDR